MGKTLVILNDPPYGTERTYNGLRIATSLAKRQAEQVRVFLIGDGASCANRGQTVPKGYYNIESMLKAITRHKVEIGVCGSCMDARGIREENLAEECRRSSKEALTNWTLWADRVVVF